MRPRRLFSAGALVAVVAGAVAVFAITGGADAPTIDQQKQAAIDEALQHPYVETEVGIGAEEPFSDVGPTEVVAAIKKAVVRNIEIDSSLDELPMDLDKRREQIRDPEAKADRFARIQRAWAGSRVAEVQEDLEESLVSADQDRAYYPYQDVEFVVTTWEGVSVDGDRASALLHGHRRFYRDYWDDDNDDQFGDDEDDDGWVDDPDAQWQVDLVRENGRWKLFYSGSFSDGEAG